MKHLFLLFFIVVLFTGQTVFSAEQIVRDDPESPLISVAKSTFYGALLGSVVALAIMIVASADDGDIFKISFVSGTALGLGYGIYHVSTRPPATAHAILNISPDNEMKLGFPHLSVGTFVQNRFKTNLIKWSF